MGGLTFDISPGDVRSKGLDPQRKNDCIEYLNLFVLTFNDRFMSGIFDKVHKSTWLSIHQAVNIEKRSANIALTQDIPKNALRYITIYWKMLLPLKISIAHRQFQPKCSQFIYDKSESLLSFFESFGYLSKAQFKAFLQPGTLPLAIIEDTLSASPKSISIIKEMQELFQIIMPKIDKMIIPEIATKLPKKWKGKPCLGWLANEIKTVSNLGKLTTTIMDRDAELAFSPLTAEDIRSIGDKATAKKLKIKKIERKPMSLESFREQFEV